MLCCSIVRSTSVHRTAAGSNPPIATRAVEQVPSVAETTAATPQDKARATALLGLLTPVAKSWPSEFGLAANDLAIQIHGGYGYTRDFDVEQIYRDNRLNPIHEGTHGIQAIDLLGRKILRDREQALELLEARIEQTAEKAEGDAHLADLAVRLREGWAEARATIPRWRANPQLVRKHYLLSEDGAECAGLYIWPTRAAAEAAHDAV